MHRVVKSHSQSFAERFSVRGSETKQFESFVNYVVFRRYSSDAIDPNDLIYSGDDPGIDGVMIFVDDIYAASEDEFSDIIRVRTHKSVGMIIAL